MPACVFRTGNVHNDENNNKKQLPTADFPNQGEVLLVHHKFSYSYWCNLFN